MEFWKSVSALIVLSSPAVVLVYDLVARRIGGPEATITAVVRGWSHDFRELPFMAAGLFLWLWLHLFWAELMTRR